MKNCKTQEITFGAMIAAIFGMLLLLNRQTGGMLEEVFLFAFPIPMVAYSAKYGWKKSLPVFAVTVLIAILCGTFSGFFYAASESFIGMVYGAMLNQKKDPGKTLFLVMVLSALANILSSVVLASLFGINLQTEMKEMQKMMIDTMEKVYGSQGMMAGAAAGTDTASMVEAMKSIFNVNYLLRIYIISMILLGVIQGLIIYQLSLIILRRLKFQVQKPQPLLQFYPPVWTGAVALTAFLCYFISMMYPLQNVNVANLVQTLGTCGYLYLICFGIIGGAGYLRRRLGMMKLFAVLLPVLCIFALPYVLVFIGFSYVSLSLHDKILGKL